MFPTSFVPIHQEMKIELVALNVIYPNFYLKTTFESLAVSKSNVKIGLSFLIIKNNFGSAMYLCYKETIFFQKTT